MTAIYHFQCLIRYYSLQVVYKMAYKQSASTADDLFRPNNPKGLRSKDLSSTRLNELKKEIHTDLHLIPLAQLYTMLGTDPTNGLTSNRAAELLDYYGPNRLTPATQNGWATVLFKSLCTGFSILIWLGASLCLVAYLIETSTKPTASFDNLYLGCVLIAVDLICGLFSFYQNYKSSKIMKTFNNMIPVCTRCIRDGLLYVETPVVNLVKGDIVKIQAGDIVPADIRIINSKGFKVDNSSLTGESVAVPRSNSEGVANILESPNVAFFSTQCVEGWAMGVVICCGDLTALGRVAGLVARLRPAPSPLAREIKRFMRFVSIWALLLGVLIAFSSLMLGYPFMQTTIFVIGIIVANVPEGLQPTITASLTLTAQNMVKKNCLVKNLEAIEALGACNVICSDKTGTLTENKMGVQNVWMANKTYLITDPEFANVAQYHEAFAAMTLCGALCTSARIQLEGGIQGDASETAILKFLGQYDDITLIRERFPKVAEIPFNSTNKYQVGIHLVTSSSRYLLVMKGAPECILPRCSTITLEKKTVDFSKELRLAAEKSCDNLANTGERILAFADLMLDPNKFPFNYKFDGDNINFPLENLRFIGLMGLIDPPRQEVKESIARVRAAGVRVMMVTGDHPATARAIAREVGIATSSCHVVTGTELRNMTSEILYWTLEKHYEIVFARTSPTQKLQIVEACQRRGSVVAVTGDGVNDAPALRRADIGISMGITGSQVSQQTADIILMDDNFSTIAVGIEEGRRIFDNLKKSVCYILISNVPEILPVLMFIMFSIPLPLGVMTILCIDLGTDMWPAVALGHERAEADVMARPARSSEPLVSARMLRLVYGHLGLIEFCAGMYAYFMVMASHGFYPSDLFGMRNHVLNLGLVFELVLASVICYVPGINGFFRTYPLKWQWWFLALPFSALMFAFDEFRKYCIRHKLIGGWYNDMTCY
ncbi:sodium/potassium-transporting ATPase subunit alpha-like isoform X2 [Plodia interpunctella]|uniref:sodium/potassium-transporting ATPase subunit alpha-like isoform X2 n=1 Tax=Plodia interpunctella TaxID=58824 RepID=UPI002368263F|nr:sodium/potassium-transporting ATPase subunit alpha-like isoform X2 [Plodia interpunctella]